MIVLSTTRSTEAMAKMDWFAGQCWDTYGSDRSVNFSGRRLLTPKNIPAYLQSAGVSKSQRTRHNLGDTQGQRALAW